MWDGEAWNMGLRDRFQLLAVRKILAKQQLSILPVRFFLIFHFIANTCINLVGESCKNHERTVKRNVYTCPNNVYFFIGCGELCKNCDRTMKGIVSTCPNNVCTFYRL